MGLVYTHPVPAFPQNSHKQGTKPMPKEMEFEGGKIIEAGMDIVLIPKQDVGFSDPPAPETEEARIKQRDKMIEFIHNKGFRMGMDTPERRVLLVDEGWPGTRIRTRIDGVRVRSPTVRRSPIQPAVGIFLTHSGNV